MYAGRAFVVGIVAAAVVSVIMLLLRMAGLPLDIPAQLAAAFGTNAWAVGLALYLLIGGAIAEAYAAIFEWVLNQSGIGRGLLLGAYNAILAGFVWALGTNPGKFWHNLGVAGTAALFLVHLVYGGVVGGLYRSKHRETW